MFPDYTVIIDPTVIYEARIDWEPKTVTCPSEHTLIRCADWIHRQIEAGSEVFV